MSKNLPKKSFLRPLKRFSETIKKQVTKDIESGKCSVSSASLELGTSPQTIYNWIYKYSRYLKKNKIMIVEEKSESYRSRDLEKQIKELEAALGRKQLEIDFLNRLIEVAGSELHLDLKKNLQNQLSNGSNKTKGKSTNTK